MAVKRARSTGAADRPQPSAAKSKSKTERRLEIPSSLTVNQLSQLLGLSVVEVIKQLMRNGVMASINQVIDYDTAATVAADFGHEAQEKQRPAPTQDCWEMGLKRDRMEYALRTKISPQNRRQLAEFGQSLPRKASDVVECLSSTSGS